MRIDLLEAIDQLGLEIEELPEFLADLKNYWEQMLPNLRECVHAGDLERLREEAHSLKGALRNMRFKDAGELVYALEQVGARTRTDNPVTILDELETCMEQSFSEAQEFLARFPDAGTAQGPVNS